MSNQFDARGLTCPLAFVLIKQQFLNKGTTIFIIDDETSCHNFETYLHKKNVAFEKRVKKISSSASTIKNKIEGEANNVVNAKSVIQLTIKTNKN